MFEPKPPLTVVVTEDRWDAIDVLTFRNFMLTQHLKAQGGINESVSPGLYHYNVRRFLFWNLVTLYPVK